jgi:hypothetical protein
VNRHSIRMAVVHMRQTAVPLKAEDRAVVDSLAWVHPIAPSGLQKAVAETYRAAERLNPTISICCWPSHTTWLTFGR